MQCFRHLSLASSLLLCAASHSFGGTFSNDFNSGTTPPPGTTLNGSAVIEATGGFNNSGTLKLTKSINGQSGSFVIDGLDGGNPVYGFDLTAKVRVGGGTSTPADGFSINFDPTASPNTTTGEEGTSGGLTFAFDIYDNANETPPAPSLDFKVGGAVVATRRMTIADFDTGNEFVDLRILVAADGAVSLAYKGSIIFTNVYFANYQPLTGASFVFGARTGGLNQNQWVDNLNITTFTQPKVGISQQPASITALAGRDVVLSVAANNADTATYRWFKNGTAVTGATAASLTLPSVAVADSGAKYKVTITGPNNTVTSDEITLTVKDIPVPSTPTLSFNFSAGATPPNTTVAGTATTTTTGGVNDSGVLQLTTDAIGLAGAFLIANPSPATPVFGFTAQFDVLVRSATTPADGFSFNFASDIPDDPTAAPPKGLEEGTGTGLTIAFDVYDNGGAEAPAIDIIFNNQVIASAKVPISFLTTGDQYAKALLRLGSDGTVDVAYKGTILHDKVSVPGFSSITGGRFAFAGRTGGLSADQWIDNLEITPHLTAGPLRIAAQPTAQTVLVGRTATFTGAANDSTGVTYQWFRNGVAISGATSASYTTPATAAADAGALFKLQATKGAAVVTSAEVALTGVDLAAPATPTASFNFDAGGIPSGTRVYGTGTGLDGNPWIAKVDSGVLQLTEAANAQAGAFLIDPLLAGAEVSALTIAFDLRIGGGSAVPADGFSLNFAPDVPEATIGGAEEGGGTGLTLGFDIYDNGNETPPAPSIDLKYKGVVLASKKLTFQQIETGDAFRTVLLRVAPEGTIDVAYGGDILFSGVRPTNYTFVSNGKFGFYARTGGLNANQWLDNIKILVTKSTAPLRITQDLADRAVLPGQTATFTVAVSDPNGATYQWSRNGVVISGATTASYTTPALTLADTGAKYTVRVVGPGGAANSREALLIVVPPLTISNPKLSLNFNDGTVPGTVIINGTAQFPGDGALHLTDAVNGQGGSVVVTDLDNGQPVSAFTLHAKVLVGGGSTPPADGFSVVWVNDLPPTTVFGEDGSGTGLILSFDIYDNGNETPPAPSIDARYMGRALGTVKLSYQQIETGAEFTDLFVRVEADGTLDVQYKGMIVFNNLLLPGYTPASGGVFGIGARTGGLNENQWIDDLEIATSTGSPPPQLTITRSTAGVITLSWNGGGTLQARDNLNSGTAWAPVTGAASPYNVPNDRTMRFFRVAQ